MDLRRWAIPPLVIAALTTVMYGFDVFESFTVEPTTTMNDIPNKPFAGRDIQKHETARLAGAAPASTQTIDVLKVNIGTTTVSRAAIPTASPAIEVGAPVNTAITQAPQDPIDEQDSVLLGESEPYARDDSTDSVVDDAEAVAFETPSMATQATPVEMSDDGEIEPDSTS